MASAFFMENGICMVSVPEERGRRVPRAHLHTIVPPGRWSGPVAEQGRSTATVLPEVMIAARARQPPPPNRVKSRPEYVS